jgi:hypothetical protein
MNWVISMVVVYFLFSGEPALINVLHEHAMQHLAEKGCK